MSIYLHYIIFEGRFEATSELEGVAVNCYTCDTKAVTHALHVSYTLDTKTVTQGCSLFWCQKFRNFDGEQVV